MGMARRREEITADAPLGTPAETQAYTLGCDIDKGPGCDIEDPAVKSAVEEAARFLVDDLKRSGVHDSVWVLFSGGGVYVEVHHDLCRPKTVEGRAGFFVMATDCFNAYIGHISDEFFREHPEHKGRVKFDALNNSKRIFKCILSIHKKKPYAVTPLSRDCISINFDRARVPLSQEMIEEARRWYSSYSPAEREPFLALLDKFREPEENRKKASFGEVWRSARKVELSDFPPCMKNIIEATNEGEGKTRFTGILSTFLYQMGWGEDEAWELVRSVSDRNGLSNSEHIFNSCFGRVSCPSCKTIKEDAGGYPHLGLRGLGVCVPDPKCDTWPGRYGICSASGTTGERQSEPTLREISLDDPVGRVGIDGDGFVKAVTCGKDGQKELAWLSDCALHIHTETSARDSTEFAFCGRGAKDHRLVSFTMPATSLADPRKFRAAVINAFGAKNRVGKLDFEVVQRLTRDPRMKKRVEVPAWDGSVPLLPGVGLGGDIEFRLSSKIPAAVYDGDLRAATACLQTLLRVHKYAPLVVAAIMGAPAVARWHKGDRFGLGLWGSTGTLKTSMVLAALAVYGIGYLDGPKLKAGRAGSTTVGAMEVFAAAGFLPQIYDDVKTVDAKDSATYVATIHAVIEGEEKARGKKDGGLRDGREFMCIPVITGEVRPSEASTSARVLNLNWGRADDKLLGEVQQNAAVLPVIGYHWLRFLAETDCALCRDFEAFRSEKMSEFVAKRLVNPGRLATIYTLMVGIWDLLEDSPLGSIFTAERERFKAALQEAIEHQG